MISITSCLLALLLTSSAFAAPASVASVSSPAAVQTTAATPASGTSVAGTSPSATGSAEPAYETVPSISLDLNSPLWGATQPERGTLGGTILGPTDGAIVSQNPDLLAPPTTDHGSVANAKWPFSLSSMRIQTGGWARQQNVNAMPIAQNIAGVNMRLAAGAVREMHWHKNGEWSYVISGYAQVTAINSDSQNYVATLGPGDLWYFPPGFPHSIQATNQDPNGVEFLLVMDVGDFSEDDTFLLTDWMAHVPVEVLAKNFKTDPSAFAHIPAKELYIFPATLPEPDSAAPKGPAGTVPNPFTFPFSKAAATTFEGGSVKIVDSRSFTASKTIAAVEVTVEPGAVRELHWHPTQDEWTYYLEGSGRVTVFASQSNARTFNYQAGDVGYIPATMGHYVENTGNTTLKFLEIFKTDVFEDISLSNWLALTPPELVKAHLGFDDATIASLPKTKPVVV